MRLSTVPLKLTYQPHLDGLRGLAALAVLLFHLKTPFSGLGFLGVDVFFVLSGYLISTIISSQYQDKTFSFSQFMKNRLVRLYPCLLVFLMACLVLVPDLFPNVSFEENVKYIVFAGFYATNFLYLADYLSPIGHTWTLAVEFHFYLLWPFVLMGLLKYQKQRMVLVLFCLWVFLGLWRQFSYSQLLMGWDVYFRSDTHCTGLVLGSMLAFVDVDALTKLQKRLLFVLLGGVVVFSLWFVSPLGFAQKEIAYWGFTVAEVMTLFVMLYPPSFFGVSLLSVKPLVWFGKISYGFYLWHYPIVRYLRLYDFSWQIDFFITFSLTLVVASLSYYWIEQPIRRWYYARGHTRLDNKMA